MEGEMDDDTKRVAALGAASLFLLTTLMTRLIHTGRLSAAEAREIADDALLAAEDRFGATTDPVFGAAVRRCLEAAVADFGSLVPSP
jgi:hypothetical protein